MKLAEYQSLIDVSLQLCGSVSAAVELAILNGVSITDLCDQVEALPAVMDADIVSYFAAKNIQPATGLVAAAERVVQAADTFVGNAVQIGSYVRVQEQQTLLDLALQETGSIEAAHAMAVINGISLTDVVEPGTMLQRVGIIDKKIKNYYSLKNIQPATGLVTAVQPPVPATGIFDFTFDFTFE